MEEYTYAAEQIALLCATRINYIVLVSLEANRLLIGVLSSQSLWAWVAKRGVRGCILRRGGNEPNVGKRAIECLI